MSTYIIEAKIQGLDLSLIADTKGGHWNAIAEQ